MPEHENAAHQGPSGLFLHLPAHTSIPLDCGEKLHGVSIGYQSYGTLNSDRSNAILVCHALTGDQFAGGTHPISGRPGWWAHLIGPGKVLDTDRYFVLCANVLGGCMGTTGPATINPATSQPWGLSFPVITIHDMVQVQVRLLDHLGIDRLFCVIGGSMGAMQALQFAASYPERTLAAVPIAGAARHSAQNIAFHEVGRQAIMADPQWDGGRYHAGPSYPKRGLAVARMAAHITYLSESALHRKFGRNLQDRTRVTYGFDADFQVESYLRHQGSHFVDRFDANSYLYVTRAMDYFDLNAGDKGGLAEMLRGTTTRYCLISFSSDWLFPTRESRAIVQALNAVAADVSFVEIQSDKGHDSFLLEEPEFFAILRGFLDGCAHRFLSRDHNQGHHDTAEQDAAPADAVVSQCFPYKLRAEHRHDLRLVAEIIKPGSRVLDVGCADGFLLEYLARVRDVDGRGLELSQHGVNLAVARGLAVVQGDADTDLVDYPDQVFDYVVLALTLQAARDPKRVLNELLRIGRHAIVSFANAGALRHRMALGVRGRAPLAGADQDDRWHSTDNIHPCTIRDFLSLCRVLEVRIERAVIFDTARRHRPMRSTWAANLFAEQALFLLSRETS